MGCSVSAAAFASARSMGVGAMAMTPFERKRAYARAGELATTIELLRAGAKCLGQGLSRRVWALPCGRWVVKVPRDLYGSKVNRLEGEGRTWTGKIDPTSVVRLPRTARERRHHVTLCYMEHVRPLRVPAPYNQSHNAPAYNTEYGRLPRWAENIDCGQVGITLDGRIVPFDYGDRLL